LIGRLLDTANVAHMGKDPVRGATPHAHGLWDGCGKKSDPDFARRKQMKERLDRLSPEFSVRLGETTSIDVTKPGIDKAYGIGKLRDTLGIAIQGMILVEDAFFPSGNDYAAKEAGALSIRLRDPDESKRAIEPIIDCFDGAQSGKVCV
jgi:phosphomannomutase